MRAFTSHDESVSQIAWSLAGCSSGKRVRSNDQFEGWQWRPARESRARSRATSKLSHYGVRTLIDFSFRAEYRRPVQDERLTSHEPDRFAHSLIQPRIRSVVIQQLTRWTSR